MYCDERWLVTFNPKLAYQLPAAQVIASQVLEESVGTLKTAVVT
jgi:hypothetical protein